MTIKIFLRFTVICLFLSFIFFSCAPYKQLKPKPQLSPQEQGYIPLKNDKKDFVLKKQKKYVFNFPPSLEDNFYLILNTPEKKSFNSFFSNSYINKKIPGEKIKDETMWPDSISVYAIDTKSPSFYWFIENGAKDVILKMNYRYAPQWRFKFETKASEYNKILSQNVVDRSIYKGIGTTTRLDQINFASAIDSLKIHLKALEEVYKELLAIESIFPKRIINSTDPAYLNYKKLRANLEDEMNFQKAYLAALNYFNKEKITRGNPIEFLDNVKDFISYFENKSIHAPNVIEESKRVLKNRLDEVIPFLNMKISGKEDALPFDPKIYSTDKLPLLITLNEKSEIPVSNELEQMNNYVKEFDQKAQIVSALKDSLEKIENYIKNGPQFPDDNFFKQAISRLNTVKSEIPEKISDKYSKHSVNKATNALNSEISKLSSLVSQLLTQYQQADVLVQQLNILKSQGDYKGMLALLMQAKQLDFLLEKYKDLDRMSIEQQVKNIKSSLASSLWQQAESGLKALHTDKNFLNYQAILPLKETSVNNLEDSLYTYVERATRTRVLKFCDEKVSVLENIDSLYADSVFYPVYDITFSSGSKKELLEKKNQLVADLQKLKDFDFPARAIKLSYEQFLKNPEDNGVLKARAVVAHGKHYQGDDKEIKMRVAECDPMAPKWITKPKEYRRIFALPVTDNRSKGAKNKYYVRLNINIETEAEFPVYDVNIKLPKEIAQNALSSQWYDAIYCNKNLLKNEGRFSIGAPTPENNYECQITPVQMNKNKNNVFEISFTYPAFKPFPLSIMVQKPIIKKN
jgi:hypothetical protein